MLFGLFRKRPCPELDIALYQELAKVTLFSLNRYDEGIDSYEILCLAEQLILESMQAAKLRDRDIRRTAFAERIDDLVDFFDRDMGRFSPGKNHAESFARVRSELETWAQSIVPEYQPCKVIDEDCGEPDIAFRLELAENILESFERLDHGQAIRNVSRDSWDRKYALLERPPKIRWSDIKCTQFCLQYCNLGTYWTLCDKNRNGQGQIEPPDVPEPSLVMLRSSMISWANSVIEECESQQSGTS